MACRGNQVVWDGNGNMLASMCKDRIWLCNKGCGIKIKPSLFFVVDNIGSTFFLFLKLFIVADACEFQLVQALKLEI